jgi:uncharacterized membrane protein
MTNPQGHWLERGNEIERTVFFSDAVFAIAITLLALEIRLPDVADDPTALQEALIGLWPKFFSFLISFWFVGNYWVAHHRVFHYIRAYDRRLLLINLLFLIMDRANSFLILSTRRVWEPTNRGNHLRTARYCYRAKSVVGVVVRFS